MPQDTSRRLCTLLARYELGHCGHRRGLRRVPLAQTFAEADQKVLLVDVVQSIVDSINRGESHIDDVPSETVKSLVDSGAIAATTDFSKTRDADAILIAVPTPLSRQREPDLSYIERAARDLAPHVREGHVVVLESTTYPGTTREVLQPLLEQGSGLKAGTDFHLAFSPERVDPGNREYTTKTTPKIVGGINDASRGGGGRAVPQGDRRRATRLDARGRRADEAAREHLPLGEHRARQRARAALRPDGHRRVGGRRRRRDEAVRLHVVQARARASAGTASRSIPSISRGRRASTTSRRASSSSPAR